MITAPPLLSGGTGGPSPGPHPVVPVPSELGFNKVSGTIAVNQGSSGHVLLGHIVGGQAPYSLGTISATNSLENLVIKNKNEIWLRPKVSNYNLSLGSVSIKWRITDASGTTHDVGRPTQSNVWTDALQVIVVGSSNIVIRWNQSNPDIVVQTGKSVSRIYSATISDGSAVTYSATGLPAGLTYSSEGVISGTVTAAAGTYNVTLSARNSAQTDIVTDLIKIKVTPLPSSNPGTMRISNSQADDLMHRSSSPNWQGSAGLPERFARSYYSFLTSNIELYEHGDNSRDHQSTVARTIPCVVTFDLHGADADNVTVKRIFLQFRLSGFHSRGTSGVALFSESLSDPAGQSALAYLAPVIQYKVPVYNLTNGSLVISQGNTVISSAVLTAIAPAKPTQPTYTITDKTGSEPALQFCIPWGNSDSGAFLLMTHMNNHTVTPTDISIDRIQVPYLGVDLSSLL